MSQPSACSLFRVLVALECLILGSFGQLVFLIQSLMLLGILPGPRGIPLSAGLLAPQPCEMGRRG